MENEYKDMTIQLTELGAIIVNSDGTLSKVENWKELTPLEQARILRVIANRNAKRRLALEQEQEQREEPPSQTKQEQEQEQETVRLAIEN